MVASFGLVGLVADQLPVIGILVPEGIGQLILGGLVQEQGSELVGVIPIGVPH